MEPSQNLFWVGYHICAIEDCYLWSKLNPCETSDIFFTGSSRLLHLIIRKLSPVHCWMYSSQCNSNKFKDYDFIVIKNLYCGIKQTNFETSYERIEQYTYIFNFNSTINFSKIYLFTKSVYFLTVQALPEITPKRHLWVKLLFSMTQQMW